VKNVEQIRIATRQSRLALWQAEDVARRLSELHPGLECELVKLTTKGDRFLDAPLGTIGGKGLFVKELEQAMLDGRADIAVHSMKDVTVDFPAGLHLPVILERASPLDSVVSTRGVGLMELPENARVGSSSLRRQCQVRAVRPDLDVSSVRGNVETRLSKLDEGLFDALVLACAGLDRLALDHRIAEIIAPEVMLPAIGQGAMGVECREGDTEVEALVAPLNHEETSIAVRAERAMNLALGGSCHAPIGGFAVLRSSSLVLEGLVGSLDGRTVLRERIEGAADAPEALGRELAEKLKGAGAVALLEAAAS